MLQIVLTFKSVDKIPYKILFFSILQNEIETWILAAVEKLY